MNPAIEQIVSSDETARATVKRAKKDAAKLIADARDEAKSMLAVLEEQIQETEHREIAPILADAQLQAQLTLDEAEQYINRLREKLVLKKKKIITAFITNAVKAENY